MASPILLCTDGSDEAVSALARGLELLGREHDFVLVTAKVAPDEGALVGSGHAGPELTPAEYDAQHAQAGREADAAIEQARRDLALPAAEVRIVPGDPGEAICRLAAELSARAIVMGSRGRGGVTRALLGSVSDYVVRRAPCTVVVTRT